MESIIQKTKECYVCNTTYNLHKHHIFYGTSNRKLSEKYGCWCYLCAYHHNMSDAGVHFNKDLDRTLKQECQIKWEKINGSRNDFIKVFGKSFI